MVAQKVGRRLKSFLPPILFLSFCSFLILAQPQTGTDRLIVGRTLDPRTGIPIITVTEENMFPQSWLAPPIKARATNLSQREMQRSVAALKDAMDKYPESYLRDNIKRIYLLNSMSLYGMSCDGTVSSDSVYVVNAGREEHTDEYIGLIFHQAFANLSLEKSRRTSGYEGADIVSFFPTRETVEVPSADRLMRRVYHGTSGRPDYIYALEKTGFIGVTLLKQFSDLPPESAVKCPLRCQEIRQSVPAPFREAIKKHLFNYRWTITDRAPVWSHDGTRIAFQSERDNAVSELYVMELDGNNIRRLTRTSYSPYQSTGFSKAVWSNNDQQLAYVMHPGGPSKLYVVNADGSGQKHLSVNDGRNSGISLIGWLSDRRILFLAQGFDKTRTVYSILPDGTGLTALTEKELVVREALLSPNQALLAITAGDKLMFKDLKTNAFLGSITSTDVSGLSWSPDSKQIAYGIGGSLIIRNLESDAVTLARSNGQDFVRDPRRISAVTWSPDGKQIVYSVDSAVVRNRQDPTELHAINVDGTASRQITANGMLPVWSPDARYIVFHRVGAGLFIVRADGSDERYLGSGVHAKWIH